MGKRDGKLRVGKRLRNSSLSPRGGNGWRGDCGLAAGNKSVETRASGGRESPEGGACSGDSHPPLARIATEQEGFLKRHDANLAPGWTGHIFYWTLAFNGL
jgi:hypothetical protein